MTDPRNVRTGHLAAATIAAVVDRTLDPAARAAAESHLAACADCREVWVETSEMAGDSEVGGWAGTPAAVHKPAPRGRARRWMYGGLGFAAATLLVTLISPSAGDSREEQMRELVAALGETRSTESRFTGGFEWNRPPTVSRGVVDTRKARVSEVAAELEGRLATSPDQLALWNAGAARVLVGDPARGIELLNDAMQSGPADPELMSDMAAALIEHGRFTGDASMFNAAVAMASRAVAVKPDLAEARFNLALALEKAGEKDRALAEWRAYRSVDRESDWAAEAGHRIDRLESPRRDE